MERKAVRPNLPAAIIIHHIREFVKRERRKLL